MSDSRNVRLTWENPGRDTHETPIPKLIVRSGQEQSGTRGLRRAITELLLLGVIILHGRFISTS